MLALVFEPGKRPDVEALTALATAPGLRVPFSISHVPHDLDNWVEVLASGLTYDCVGLSPGASASTPEGGALLGLHEPPQGETVTIQPAPHLAEGRGLLPVLQAMAGLGAQFGSLPGLLAAYWHPGRCWMAPKYFCGVMEDWLDGGAFPALGFTSLHREADGGMVSVGLDYLIGQELRFLPDRRLIPAAIARMAVRLIHQLVESGPLRSITEFVGPEGERVQVTPVNRGRLLQVTVLR